MKNTDLIYVKMAKDPRMVLKVSIREERFQGKALFAILMQIRREWPGCLVTEDQTKLDR